MAFLPFLIHRMHECGLNTVWNETFVGQQTCHGVWLIWGFIASHIICIKWRKVICLFVSVLLAVKVLFCLFVTCEWVCERGYVNRSRFYTWLQLWCYRRWIVAMVWSGRASGAGILDQFQGSDGVQGTTHQEQVAVVQSGDENALNQHLSDLREEKFPGLILINDFIYRSVHFLHRQKSCCLI